MFANHFKNKVAVVSGCGGGMGLAVAQMLADSACQVYGLDKKPAPRFNTNTDQGIQYFQGDLTDPEFVSSVMEQVQQQCNQLDYLVNTAGVLWFDRDRSFVDMNLQDWDEIMTINLKSVVHTGRAALPLMQANGGGAMVHFSSIQCLRGDNHPQDAYQASKAAIIALSKSIAIQFAGDGIRSNVILPGPCHTPMQQRWDADNTALRNLSSQIPLGRVGQAQDMANACCFLLSDLASFITGTELIVDGGIMAKP